MFSVCRVNGLPVYGLLCLGFVVSRVLYSTKEWQDNLILLVNYEYLRDRQSAGGGDKTAWLLRQTLSYYNLHNIKTCKHTHKHTRVHLTHSPALSFSGALPIFYSERQTRRKKRGKERDRERVETVTFLCLCSRHANLYVIHINSLITTMPKLRKFFLKKPLL